MLDRPFGKHSRLHVSPLLERRARYRFVTAQKQASYQLPSQVSRANVICDRNLSKTFPVTIVDRLFAWELLNMGLPGQILKGELNSESSRLTSAKGGQHGGSARLRYLFNTMTRTLRVDSLRCFLARRFENALNLGVRQIDAWLRQRQGIHAFVEDDECLLRISMQTAERDLVLSDKTEVKRGDALVELHLWNEHFIPIPRGGPDMIWAVAIRRRMQKSLAALAAKVESDPRFANINVFHAETALGTGKPNSQAIRVAHGLGFEVTDGGHARGVGGWFVSLGESIYLWGMGRTFTPGIVKGNRLVKPQWHQLWMSRRTLMARYGRGGATKNSS